MRLWALGWDGARLSLHSRLQLKLSNCWAKLSIFTSVTCRLHAAGVLIATVHVCRGLTGKLGVCQLLLNEFSSLSSLFSSIPSPFPTFFICMWQFSALDISSHQAFTCSPLRNTFSPEIHRNPKQSPHNISSNDSSNLRVFEIQRSTVKQTVFQHESASPNSGTPGWGWNWMCNNSAKTWLEANFCGQYYWWVTICSGFRSSL